jgi:hypothetical protein
MATSSVFQDQSLFNVQEITAALNRKAWGNRIISSMNLFKNVPTTGKNPIIERMMATRQVIEGTDYRTRKSVGVDPDRQGISVPVWKASDSRSIFKDDVVGIRDLGTNQVLTVAKLISQKMDDMRYNVIENTIESWRLQAILGKVQLSTNRKVDWLANWNVTQPTKNYSNTNNGTAPNVFFKEVTNVIDDALQGTMATGYCCFLSDAAYSTLFQSEIIQKAYSFRTVGDMTLAMQFVTQMAGAPNPNNGVAFGNIADAFNYGNITFINYRDSVAKDVLGNQIIPSGKGICFPLGVDGMFTSSLVPSTFMSDTSATGSEFYARTYYKDDDDCVCITVESCRVEANALPEATVLITFA